MPYIEPDRRDLLDPVVAELLDRVEDWGDVNYAVTTLLHGVLHGATYEDYQAALGLCAAVQAELYRRVVGPYEDLKIAEHGDL